MGAQLAKILMVLSLVMPISIPGASAKCAGEHLGGTHAWSRSNQLFKEWLGKGKDDPSHWTWMRITDLGDGKPAKVRYTLTHQGNGTIEIKNLLIRVWREHVGEGFTYEPAAFVADLVPSKQNQFCALIVAGTIKALDEETEWLVRSGTVRLVFDYDPRTGRFKRTSGHAPIPLNEIDLSDQ